MDQNADFSMTEALRLAQTPAGRQLIAMIQQQNSSAFRQAMSSAVSGDYRQAQELLTPLLQNPDIQALLKQLGGSDG